MAKGDCTTLWNEVTSHSAGKLLMMEGNCNSWWRRLCHMLATRCKRLRKSYADTGTFFAAPILDSRDVVYGLVDMGLIMEHPCETEKRSDVMWPNKRTHHFVGQ